jgi:hypothetical protein
MKPLPLVIAASVAANVALLAFVLNPAAPAHAAAGTAAAQAAAVTAAQRAAARAKAAPALDPQLWTHLAADDLPALIASLRAAGFPDSVIRAIAAAHLREAYLAKSREFNPAKGDTPFWKRPPTPDAKTRATLRDLARAQTEQLNHLFGGPDPEASLARSFFDHQQFAGLPGDKTDQLSRVKHDYDDMRDEVYQNMSGGGGAITMLPEDRAKLALLDKEQRADFAQILTPQELADYNLRSSNTAMQLRYNLSAFEPTEAEFRAVFKLQEAFDEKNGQMGPGKTQEQMRLRMEEQKKVNEQIKTALGSERGADYERAIDYTYRQAALIAERLDLPKTAAVDVWNVQKDVEKRTAALFTDPSTVAPEARTAQRAALMQEANAKVVAALGEKGAAIYKQNGGFWLQTPQPRPTTPTTTTGIHLGP